jgi:hypothetical protein
MSTTISGSSCGGIPCPQCGLFERSIIETRPRAKAFSIYRRCLCSNCGTRFTTQEQLATRRRPVKQARLQLQLQAQLDALHQIERIERNLAALRRSLPSAIQ